MNNTKKRSKKSSIYQNRAVVHLILFLISNLIVFFALNERKPILLIVKSLCLSIPSLVIYGTIFLIKDEIAEFKRSKQWDQIVVIAMSLGGILFCLWCIYLFLQIPFK